MTTTPEFDCWWKALAAVPVSTLARDFWAPEENSGFRSPRYERLKRVWGDPTDTVPLPFYCVEKEKHLVSTLWENFAMFNPGDTVRALYSALGFDAQLRADPPGDVRDLCFSYEFNLGHQQPQLDIVLHVRFEARDEIILCEAKPGCKKYEDKDLEAKALMSRPAFEFAPCRWFFLLGDAKPPSGWSHGHLTWPDLRRVQAELARALPVPDPVGSLVADLIEAQYAGHGIGPSTAALDALEAQARSLTSAPISPHVKDFVRTGLCHLRALHGRATGEPPFDYLRTEPRADAIVRGWCDGAGSARVNGKRHWQLPPRPVAR